MLVLETIKFKIWSNFRFVARQGRLDAPICVQLGVGEPTTQSCLSTRNFVHRIRHVDRKLTIFTFKFFLP